MTISLHPDTPQGRTLAASPVADAAPAAPLGKKIRSRLFTKYVALFVAVFAVALQVPLAGLIRSARAAASAFTVAAVALVGCCLAMPLAATLDATGASIVAIAAVLALTLAELTQSAGAWEISFRLAPADRRGHYLSMFSLGQTAQTMVGPVLLTAVVFALGTLGWAVLAAATLAAGLLAPVSIRNGQPGGD